VLERGELIPRLIDDLAAEVAAFHASIERATADSGFGSAASITAPALQNFEQLEPLLHARADVRLLRRLQVWTVRENQRLAARFAERQRDGFVRECHGDLHLGNMVLIAGKVRIFDAIEFNPALRWIDVISEVAFLVMDLIVRGRQDLGWRFLNTYLEHTGDYEGMRVLRYYIVYRAVVRAKVAAMRAEQANTGEAERAALSAKRERHLATALQSAEEAHPSLVVLHGLSGSGKTWWSQPILESIGAVRIRSDVERKRLHGLDREARTGSPVGEGIYAPDATRDTYARMARLAESVLDGGCTVLVDATFLKHWQRDVFRDLAARLHVPFRIAHFDASPPTLAARIASRAAQGTDASEAGMEVLQAQLRGQEPLTAEEQAVAATFDTERLTTQEVQGIANGLVGGSVK
jgi:uncharacterized protein